MGGNSRSAPMILRGSPRPSRPRLREVLRGSARVPRADERVLAIADFSVVLFTRGDYERYNKVRFAATPKPARQRRALPYCIWRNQPKATEDCPSFTS